jgi:DNA-binding response OmpR family regulator
MRTQTEQEQLMALVGALAEMCLTISRQVNELAVRLDPQHPRSAGGQLGNLMGGNDGDVRSLYGQVIVDHAARAITYRGRTCRLGNTLVFRLMERLARRSGHYVTFDRLIREVWDGQARTDDAIRSVMKELRRRLRRGGMRRLADSIEGQNRAYALRLDG